TILPAPTRSSSDLPVPSSAATVTVDSAAVGGVANALANRICAGSAATIRLAGQSGTIQKWQSSTDGISWTDVPGSASANPLTSGALGVTTSIHALVQSGNCSPIFSSVATVTVDNPAVGGSARALANEICAGGSTTITLAGQSGEIQKWQKSIDGGAKWVDILSNGSPLATGALTQTTQFRAV